MKKHICPPPEPRYPILNAKNALAKSIRRGLRMMERSSPADNRVLNSSSRSTGRRPSNGATRAARSLQELDPQELEEATWSLNRLTTLFDYLGRHREDVADAYRVHGRFIAQEQENQRLKAQINTIHAYKETELERVSRENQNYQANAEEFEANKLKLDEKELALRDDLANMQQTLQTEREAQKVKMSERLQRCKGKLREEALANIAEADKKRMTEIEKMKAEVRGHAAAHKEIKEAMEIQRTELMEQLLESKTDGRARLLYIAELEQRNASLSVVDGVVEQKIDFYEQRFSQVKGLIIEIGKLATLSEDISPDKATIQWLRSISDVFKDVSFDSDGPAASFLRQCATQQFISLTVFPITQRLYFVIGQDGTPMMDHSLEELCQKPHVNPQHELIWKLATVSKLDDGYGIGYGPQLTESARKEAVLKALSPVVTCFQKTDEIYSRLEQLASIVIELWSAMRRDRYRLNLNFAPPPQVPTGHASRWSWARMDNEAMESAPPQDQVQSPHDPQALFPCITTMILDDGSRLEPSTEIQLVPGLALSGRSPAFLMYQLEEEKFQNAIKYYRRHASMSQTTGAPSIPNLQQ